MTELWVYVELCREGIRPVTFELLGKAAELSARCGGRGDRRGPGRLRHGER